MLILGKDLRQIPLKRPPVSFLKSSKICPMSFCNTGPSAGPNSANLMEWVEQQAVRLSKLPEASTVDRGIAPLSQAFTVVPPHEPSAKLNPNLSLANAKSRVYDIATLYALRKEAARKNIELKIHTDALKGRQPTHLECFKLLLLHSSCKIAFFCVR